ncbi:hypothetical protein G7K_3783-t1 [Saitoella complicata NRRL Y-17804]|uniref:Partial AB-hydrolase lipase domain-containing protein n=2 Tax=Saitoella complicata (strain BCRC 22490 / CBS 7301 / JCM 7358 / NBRC 10748 / NRRL Y-17804) TaxID=698492 RepID=A0A0E9NIG0_SAICN|nr:hypothetical protein G7K_3783-t1 [Saitoella complicata NRRL Y-17804]
MHLSTTNPLEEESDAPTTDDYKAAARAEADLARREEEEGERQQQQKDRLKRRDSGVQAADNNGKHEGNDQDDDDNESTGTQESELDPMSVRAQYTHDSDGNPYPAAGRSTAKSHSVLQSLHDKVTHLRHGLTQGHIPLTDLERGQTPDAAQSSGRGQQGENIDGQPQAGEQTNVQHAPAFTNPLFPPLPLYGPPSFLRSLQVGFFRCIGLFLSLMFLMCVVLGAEVTHIPVTARRLYNLALGRDPDMNRPFIELERRRMKERKENGRVNAKITRDVGYYARMVGLDCAEETCVTDDGFVLHLHHIIDPNPPPHLLSERLDHEKKRYPVLLLHGLLQAGGSFCTNDEDSLAFWLCKQGYDVWVGNNRCWFNPQHVVLKYGDPRMWAWNIRQMGTLDLPAMVRHIGTKTRTEKVGLVAHSQGTTQTFVALAREQVPGLGNQISVFCALAPAVYAGPLISRAQFKFMRILSPSMFRIFFGIHAFIPFMVWMNKLLVGRARFLGVLYGYLGYLVFAFLFGWSDRRWDRGLRSRFFAFAPCYVSAESMRWWMGRDGFAKHKCILEDGEGEGWYGESMPPVAMWHGGADRLVDSRSLQRRMKKEEHVKVVRDVVIDEYEHLDVIWAVDMIEKVGKGVRDAIWETVEGDGWVCPIGCKEEDRGKSVKREGERYGEIAPGGGRGRRRSTRTNDEQKEDEGRKRTGEMGNADEE